jgi:hypothetical protein
LDTRAAIVLNLGRNQCSPLLMARIMVLISIPAAGDAGAKPARVKYYFIEDESPAVLEQIPPSLK